MDWNALQHACAAVPLPQGYGFEALHRHDVAEVIGKIQRWYPDICVGTASCLMRPDFYRDRVVFDNDSPGHVFVVTIRHDDDIVGVVACEREPDALSLYGRVIIVAPDHRGARLGRHGLVLIESIGRVLGMGLVYGLATLKIPHIQQAFESERWRLIGIVPGLDRELAKSRGVQRVFEAIYAKVIASPGELQQPDPGAMTPRVRALFNQLFQPVREAHG